MKSSSAGSTLAFLVAILVLAGIVALADLGDSPVVAVALLATVPLFAAILLGPLGTAVVAILAVAAAVVIPWLRSDGDYSDYLVPLAAVGLSSVVAVLASAVRHRREVAGGGAEADLPLEVDSADADPMTGLMNRSAAIRTLGARNDGDERVLAFVDCDDFQAVNQTYGRAVGDEFLQAVAGRLRHALPARDTVAHWDGDEFLVVVSATAAKARPALTRVVGTVNGHPIRTSAGPIESTLSAGAATWLPGQDLEGAIARAGQALRDAKASGRGEVAVDTAPAPDEARPATDLA